jgi:hypothetical protein
LIEDEVKIKEKKEKKKKVKRIRVNPSFNHQQGISGVPIYGTAPTPR